MASPSVQLPSRERPSPFSLEEFSDLVCSAFNLGTQQPALSLAPTSSRDLPATVQSASVETSLSCFDTDTDDDHISAYLPSRAHSTTDASRLSVTYTKSRASALNMLKQVRVRASALVLRPANTNIDFSNSEPLAPQSLPRISVSSQNTVTSLTNSSFAFLSRPHTPFETPRPSVPFPFNSTTDLALSRSRTRTRSFPGPMSILKFSHRQVTPATISPAVSACTTEPPSARVDLPSFFEDTGYTERRPVPPTYSRPTTPVTSATTPLRVHARLPPLRKAKSASTGIFRGRGTKSKGPCPESAAVAAATIDGQWTFDEGEFMRPRDPPPVPPIPVRLRGLVGGWEGEGEDNDALLEVPDYVFARRGSATSTCTTSTMDLESNDYVHGLERVFTLESDPFKKAEIEVERGDSTPTPRSGTPLVGRTRRPRGLGIDMDGADGIQGIDIHSWREGARGFSKPPARRIPTVAAIFDSPSPRSPAYTFPSSCSVYTDQAGRDEEDVPDTPSTIASFGDRAFPVSRFSTPSSSRSFRSSCSSMLDAEEARERAFGGDINADIDATFVFGSPAPAPVMIEGQTMESASNRRATVEECPSPAIQGNPQSLARRARVAARASMPPSPPSAPAKQTQERKSLPPSPPISMSRYIQRSPASPTRRKASVRTVASEPAPGESRGVMRPGSPFPLMRGLSDGSPRGREGRRRKLQTRYEAKRAIDDNKVAVADDQSKYEEDLDFVDSGVMIDMSVVVNPPEQTEDDEDALEDSFVLPAVEAAKLFLRSDKDSMDIDYENKAVLHPPSPSGSCIRLGVANGLHSTNPSTDSDATMTPERYQSALRRESLREAEREVEWDRCTALSSATTQSSSCSAGTFYSARSSVESTP
ncbi:hypothetical protein POSPLADRAFT_1165388 [Postia placenta MAD-698-R-SB12]|uniref:Uncharacterized protein n=1 Tax=Postia placenta MAD-698-R-SB12 TaxID=670580 RepID=A0A1X6NGU8_9APHY|nr:hypothetical protein POSPLADRAFT_1165388 [Postia placenta MAD-698-R-SB12]OSX67861.1 hypothetical protein POSPLADRAFT_1165388 [Postia placenta MAD-698-R-SB12]